MENSDNIAPVPRQSLPSASPLAGMQQPMQSQYQRPVSPQLVSPIPKQLRILYLLVLPLNVLTGVLLNLFLSYGSASSVDSYITRPLALVFSGMLTVFTVYVFIRQYLVIRKYTKGAFVTYILPPVVSGVLIGGGMVFGALAAIADYGDEVASNALGYMITGFAVMIGVAISLCYFYGLGEMLYIAKQGVLGGWRLVIKVLTILLYVASGILALFIASIVHSLLDPSTE